jgi:lysyl-tRNA synthetase, class II
MSEIEAQHDELTERREKLTQLREQGIAFPNDFRREHLAAALHSEYNALSHDDLEQDGIEVSMAGRMMTKRVMGKASFVHIQDMSGQMQLYVARDSLPEGVYAAFKKWDLGDILGVKGRLFKTKTGELSVFASEIRLLTKSLRPLPDKFHGLADQELRYRQRYLDLIANEDSRRVFSIRSKTISVLRSFLEARGFQEVETPMMQTLAGGAAARPFKTHHNALDMPLYLRIAPELFLKRLVVGGVERVFEINRNFRNEGISTRHNPEFTMVEFYQAYANYQDLMDLTEALLKTLVEAVHGGNLLTYQGQEFDMSKPFARMTVKESILSHNPDIDPATLEDIDKARSLANQLGIDVDDHAGLGKIQIEIFEKTVEKQLVAPTFITAYPTEVSPLARMNDDDPFVTDRFEFFVGGQELANGFSELNDPEDQAERFKQQVAEKQAGDMEAMPYDEDYVLALEHGLPPTAGEGIGIDRLVMLLADVTTIRDVILFPLMRPKEGP